MWLVQRPGVQQGLSPLKCFDYGVILRNFHHTWKPNQLKFSCLSPKLGCNSDQLSSDFFFFFSREKKKSWVENFWLEQDGCTFESWKFSTVLYVVLISELSCHSALKEWRCLYFRIFLCINIMSVTCQFWQFWSVHLGLTCPPPLHPTPLPTFTPN